MADVKVTLKRVTNDQGSTDNIYPTTSWDQIEEKPTTFTPTAHTHTAADINSENATAGKVLAANGSGGASWETIAATAAFNGGTITGNLTIDRPMQDGTNAYTSPHLVLSSTDTINTTGFVGMVFDTSTATNFGWSYGAQRTSDGNGDLVWRNHDSSTAGVERMRLLDNGNLGIGITNPTFKLAIDGGSQTRGIAYFTQSSPTNSLALDATTSTLHKIYTNDAAASLSLGTGSSTNQLYLKNDGNVGIGTTSPASKLHIETSTAAESIIFNNTSLEVNSSNIFGLSIRESGNEKISLKYRRDNSGIGELILLGNSPFVFGTNSTERLRIDAGGNVGIGTTSPGQKLDVIGNIKASQEFYSGNNIVWHAGNFKPNVDTFDVLPTYSASNEDFIKYNITERAVEVQGSDDSFGAVFPAFKIYSGAKYQISFQIKSNVNSSIGVYFRMQEFDGDLPAGKTHISNLASHPEVQEDTRQIFGFYENSSVGTSWSNHSFIYTPTDTAQWASALFMNWIDLGTNSLFIKNLKISAVNENADTLSGIASSQFVRSDTGDSIAGNHEFYSTDITGAYSNAAIELRETNLVGSAQTAIGYAPSISWHWGGIAQTSMRLLSNGKLTLDGNHTGQLLTTTEGTAVSATTLQTARTLTIGSTGKTFNGSANVSWSLAEIGAQPSGSYLTQESDTLASVTARGQTQSRSVTGQLMTLSNTAASTSITTGALTVSGGVGIAGALNLGGELIVGGNLTINGTTTTLNARELTVDDKNIELGSVTSKTDLVATLATGTNIVNLTTGNTSGIIPGQVLAKNFGAGAFGIEARVGVVNSATQFTVFNAEGSALNHSTAGSITFTIQGASDASANGGGITLKGTTDKTIIWNATSGWNFNQPISTTGSITLRAAATESIASHIPIFVLDPATTSRTLFTRTIEQFRNDIDVEPAFTKNTAFNKNFGTTSGTVAEGNDARFTDARTPLAHTHVKADITDFAHTHVKADITDFAHTHAKADITDFAHTHAASDITSGDITPRIPWASTSAQPFGTYVGIGGGSDTVIASGEARSAYETQFTGNNRDTETLYLLSDQNTIIRVGLQSGWSSGINALSISNAGVSTFSSTPTVNGTAVSLNGHTHVKANITDFAHTHVKADITDFAHTHVKADITDFAHTHAIADVTGLQDALNGKAASSHTHGNITNAGAIGSAADLVVVTGASGVLTTASRSGIDSRATFPPSAHTHNQLVLAQNPTGTTYGNGVSALPTNFISQGAGDNDAWRIYGESVLTNNVRMVLQLEDDIEVTNAGWIFRNKKTYADYLATEPFVITGTGDISFTGTLNAGTVPWARLSNIPSTFAPSAHTHVKADITDFAHTHVKADITDFAHTHVKADITDFAHTHAIADVTGLQTVLDGKAASSHTHGNITNAGAIGTTTNLVVVTGASGVLTTASRSGIDTRTSFPPDTHTHTITANATDGLFDITGTNGTNAVTYAVAPYATNQSSILSFDTSTTAPTRTDRLNLNGSLHTTNVNIYGNNSLLFATHGGGFNMTDTTWIRTTGNKSFYHNTGSMRTDGTLQVGSSGGTLNVANDGNFAYRTNTLFANTSGNVGIGNADPGSNRLRVLGGAVQFEKDGHTTGSNAYSLELYSPQLTEVREISLRFHQGNRWYHQIRSSGAGFRLTSGENNNLVSLTASNVLADNVGIGTTSPGSAIHVKKATPEIKLESGSTTDSGTMRYNTTTKSIEFIFA